MIGSSLTWTTTRLTSTSEMMAHSAFFVSALLSLGEEEDMTEFSLVVARLKSSRVLFDMLVGGERAETFTSNLV
jgi:hypothetical protein